MPNLWCALGSLAATGWTVRTLRGASRPAETTGAASAVALVALMRPADGFWLALPLMFAAVLVPGRRRPGLGAALAGGLVVGCAPWTAEAFAHYGGPVARFHRAGEIQGGLGWNFAVDDHLRALAGRTLCRPCDIGWESPATAVWWVALPLLTTGGIVAARRAGRGPVALLATATGVSTAVPYLFLVEYAAPRFLLPAYALLAVPVAEYLTHLFARRRVGTVVPALLLAAHLGVQFSALSHVIRTSHATGARFAAVAGALNGMGVRAPCVVSGDDAVPIAYYAGCASRQTGGHDASITPEALRDLARHVPVAVLVTGGAAPPVTRGSHVVPLPKGRAHLLPGPAVDRARGGPL